MLVRLGADQGARISIRRTRAQRHAHRRILRFACVAVAAAAPSLALGIEVDVPIPSPADTVRVAPPAAGADAAVSAPVAVAPVPLAPVATVPAMTTTPTVTAPVTVPATLTIRALRVGMFGEDVRQLQRILSERGARIAIDGAFGPATLVAVRRAQRRMRLPATGRASVTFLARLGLRSRLAAAATPPAPIVAPTPTATPGVGQYTKVFPVAADYRYSNDFGAPRSQGSHEGNDILAPRNTPIVAVAAGTITRANRLEKGLGGIYLWLKDASGTEYYYAHMQSIVDGIDVGTSVSVGQPIGAVGNSGDARYGATHLHFEVHPGGAASPAINPYSDLVAVDPKPRPK